MTVVKILVTLIHGTWAPNSPWTVDEGVFQNRLQEKLSAEMELVFEVAEPWTGANRFADRQNAAASLSKQIEAGTPGSDTDGHVVIGHSHGGSAITYALNQFADRMRSVDGAAFLATPFIHARTVVGWDAMLASAVRISVYFAWMAMLYLGVYAIAEYLLDIGDIGASIAFMVLAVLTIGWFLVSPILCKKVIQVFEERILRAKTELKCSELPAGKLYAFLRATGDEAASALSTAQFLCWPITRLFAASARISNRTSNAIVDRWRAGWRWKITGTVVVLFLVIGHMALFVHLYQHYDGIASLPSTLYGALISDVYDFIYIEWLDETLVFILRLFIAVATLMFATVVLLSALFTLSTAVVSIAYIAFGGSAWRAGPFIEFAVEPLPRGSHKLSVIDWESTDERQSFSLNHSESYLSDRSLDSLSEWLLSVAESIRSRSTLKYS